MNRRLLLISPFFYPELISTGRYNTFLAKALTRKGVGVDVICFHPLYPDWRPRYSAQGMPGVRIARGGGWIRYPGNSLLRRLLLECAFGLHILAHAGRFKHYATIVSVIPPMLFQPLIWMVARRRSRVITIAHDLQGIMAAVGIKRGRGAGIRLLRRMETLILKCCHRVVALSDGMADFMAACYGLPRSKITVCRPFVTVGPCEAGNRLAHLFDENKKHVVYAGALGYKQCPEKLVEFLYRLAQERGDVVCHVFSGGPLFDAFRRDPKWNGHRLAFHDLVPECDLWELYLRSHIQVIPETAGLSRGAVPSKLPNLLAAGVPILYVGEKDSDVWRLIQGCRAGACCDSWDFDILSDLADQLLVECGKHPHAVRRLRFVNQYADLFGVEALIKALLE
jgi:colanic acid biosynthesis glycosyl transferase WcaI